MTVTELVDFFDRIQDKYGSPYFTTAEKEQFLNQAQLGLISDSLPKEGDEENIERNANVWTMFNPLFFSTTSTMNSSGLITKSSLETALTTLLGFTVSIIRPLSITWADTNGTRSVKGPTRQNNWGAYKNNVFKVPVESDPRYYETNTDYVIEPINTAITLTINGLRYPKPISVSGAQTAEISALHHKDVVARALEIAGIGSRDEIMAQLQKMNKI
jgi:hypothetical protein